MSDPFYSFETLPVDDPWYPRWAAIRRMRRRVRVASLMFPVTFLFVVFLPTTHSTSWGTPVTVIVVAFNLLWGLFAYGSAEGAICPRCGNHYYLQAWPRNRHYLLTVWGEEACASCHLPLWSPEKSAPERARSNDAYTELGKRLREMNETAPDDPDTP